MTEKELNKLRKQDFLELLLTQGQQMAELQATLEATTAELEETKATNERLKVKLNEKDELIEKLKGRLDNKDATIHSLRETMESERESRKIELEEAGSIAMAALRLNGVFEAAQAAADQYIYNVKMLCDEGRLVLENEAEDPETAGGDSTESEEDKAFALTLPDKAKIAAVPERIKGLVSKLGSTMHR